MGKMKRDTRVARTRWPVRWVRSDMELDTVIGMRELTTPYTTHSLWKRILARIISESISKATCKRTGTREPR